MFSPYRVIISASVKHLQSPRYFILQTNIKHFCWQALKFNIKKLTFLVLFMQVSNITYQMSYLLAKVYN